MTYSCWIKDENLKKEYAIGKFKTRNEAYEYGLNLEKQYARVKFIAEIEQEEEELS